MLNETIAFFLLNEMLGSKQAQVKRTDLNITLRLKLLPVLIIKYPEICYLFSLLATLAS